MCAKKTNTPKVITNGGQQNATLNISQTSIYMGSLPPPEYIKQYEEFIPNAADRILTMAEKEQAHRHNREICEQKDKYKQVRRGQWMGWAMGLFALSTAAVLGYFGQGVAAGCIGSFSLIGLVSVFVTGKAPRQISPPSEKNMDNKS